MVAQKFRFLLTEKCNADCPNCFNSNYRKTDEMNLEKLDKVCKYLSKNGVKSVKIMGGEPTLHSEYVKAIEVFQSYFKRVSIFTNAISNNLYKTPLRECDSIIYNFNFLTRENIIEKMMEDKLGYRALEIQINKDTDVNRIIDVLEVLIGEPVINKIGINLTLDCTVTECNEFNEIKEKWYAINEYISKYVKCPVNIDHKIPICIKRSMDIKTNRNGLCSVMCAGLIDANFNLLFCNQYPVKLGSIWLNDTNMIEFSKLEKLYRECFKIKESFNYKKQCFSCELYGNKCNGGCFMHRLIKG